MPDGVDSPRALVSYARMGGKGPEMPENVSAVDSVETLAEVDSKAVTASENPSMEDSSTSKTFTADELDAAIKRRIDKQNAKHAQELDALNAKIKELEDSAAKAEAERDELQRKSDAAKWTADAAEKFGVKASLLRGATKEEIFEHAEQLSNEYNGYPESKSTGKPANVSTASTKAAKFDEFMKSNFS